jgi:hypothetical protein
MLASVLPRQSVSPAISWSIRSDGFIGSVCLQFLSRFHGISFISRSLRNKSSKDMAFPHPKSRKEHYRNDDKPNTGGVLWNVFKRTINIPEYRNAKDDVNPAKNRAFRGLFHDLVCPPFIGDTASGPFLCAFCKGWAFRTLDAIRFFLAA